MKSLITHCLDAAAKLPFLSGQSLSPAVPPAKASPPAGLDER